MLPTIKQTNYAPFKGLQMLEELEKEIIEESGKSFWDTLGVGFYYWSDEETYYPSESMPIDTILLGTTVISHCSFGFLTEFSTIEDLEHAPIIQHEEIGLEFHANLTAKNFIDFLRLIVTQKSIFGLMSEENDEEEVSQEVDYVITRIMERFDIKPFESVGDYRRKLKSDRDSSVAIQTINGLGVKPMTGSSIHQRFLIDEEDHEKTLDDLILFFSTASLESKLAYIRDA